MYKYSSIILVSMQICLLALSLLSCDFSNVMLRGRPIKFWIILLSLDIKFCRVAYVVFVFEGMVSTLRIHGSKARA